VQVDGNCPPRFADLLGSCTVEAIVKGDATVAAISAASILAKTFRDALMERMDAHYPGFGFAVHKGYATPSHLAALRVRAPTPLHRLSFEPVRQALAGLLSAP
jgi:ribonuclease HII